MRKITVILAGVTLTVAVTAFAAGVGFTDQNSFDGWYKNAVIKLNNLGVIGGYPDGSFKPGNNVNRAELAVMLSKYDDYRIKNFDDLLATKLMAFMSAQKQFSNLNNVPEYFKNLIILTETGLRRVNGKPSDLDQYSLVTDIGDLPAGYSIYQRRDSIIIPAYVHYKGPRLMGDVEEDVDEWYGPF